MKIEKDFSGNFFFSFSPAAAKAGEKEKREKVDLFSFFLFLSSSLSLSPQNLSHQNQPTTTNKKTNAPPPPTTNHHQPDGGVTKKISTLGKGFEKPEPGDEVTVHYVGTLAGSGEEFDSSRSRGQPFVFKLGQGQVIKGWDVGVATMKRGERSTLTIRAEYGYGEQGSPPKIPGGATLCFDVELLSWRSFKDVTGDGGVIKTTVAGTGGGWKAPSERDIVTVSYKLYEPLSAEAAAAAAAAAKKEKKKNKEEVEGDEEMKQDDEKEKVVLADEPHIAFELGDADSEARIPRGIVEAARTMKKGERATLKLSAAYGPKKDAAAAAETVAAEGEVELVSWEAVEEISPGLTKRTLVETESWTKPSPGSTVTVLLEGRFATEKDAKGRWVYPAAGAAGGEGGVFFPKREVEFVVDDEGVGKVAASSDDGGDKKGGAGDAPPSFALPIPEGLDDAVRHVAERERCVISCGPEHAFGAEGLGAIEGLPGSLPVPAGAGVEWELELVGLQKAKESWEMDEPEKIAAAESAKQAGNARFKAGKFAAAAKKYGRALNFVEYDSGFGAEAKAQAAELKKACNLNLAAARLRTKDWRGAVTAADKVLEKDGLNAKALYRRAQARLALQDFVEAERDARVALAEDAAAPDLRLLLARIKREAAAYDRKQAKTYSNLFGKMAAMEAAEERKKKKEEEKEKEGEKEKEKEEAKGGETVVEEEEKGAKEEEMAVEEEEKGAKEGEMVVEAAA